MRRLAAVTVTAVLAFTGCGDDGDEGDDGLELEPPATDADGATTTVPDGAVTDGDDTGGTDGTDGTGDDTTDTSAIVGPDDGY